MFEKEPHFQSSVILSIIVVECIDYPLRKNLRFPPPRGKVFQEVLGAVALQRDLLRLSSHPLMVC